jgi:hypothetical protein
MFKHTCFVKASRNFGGAVVPSSRENDGGSDSEHREELHRVGELCVLLYSGSIGSVSSMGAALSLNGAYDTSASTPPLHTFRSSHWPISRPRSWSYLRSSCVSSRNKIPTVSPQMTTAVQTRFGSRYGNVSKIVPLNKVGKASAGRARPPPSVAPMMVLQKSGQCQDRKKSQKRLSHTLDTKQKA